VIQSIPGEFPSIAHMEVGPGDILYISLNSSEPEYAGAGVLQVEDDGTLTPRVGVFEVPEAFHEQLFGYIGRAALDNESAKRPVASGYPFSIGSNSEIVFNLPGQIVRLREMFPGYSGANYQIPTPGGSSVDEFSPEGRHLATFDALTGTELLRFEYDAEGRLLTVLYRDQNASEVARQNGEPTKIIGPDGVEWSLTTTGGMLTSLVSPEGEQYQFEYDNGLMTKMVNPRGEEWRFSYDLAGRLISDEQPNGGMARLERDKDRNSVKFTSPAGRETTYFSTPPNNQIADNRVTTGDFESGTTQLRDGWSESFAQDGTKSRTRTQSHPIYGMIAGYAAEAWLETPSGLRTEVSSELSALNADFDLKSGLDSFTRTLRHSRGVAQTTWDRATLTLSSESAENRRSKTMLDTEGRPARVESPGIEPVVFEYDTRNRPIRVTQGARSVSTAYGVDGFVESVTGADGTVRLSRDAMGRVTRGTRVDMTSVDFAYDLLGNITEVSPPDRPAYTMNSDYRGDMLDMTTPGGTLHSYVFDLDHRLTSATMGDGRGWTLAYDSSNRLDQINVGVDTYDFNYGEDAHLAEVLGGEANIAFVWDGPLPISQTTSGAVNGSVDWTWEDGTLSLGSMSINGEVINYTYDNDGLPLQIGAESLSYLANTYFLKQRTVGTAQVDYTYSEFGELSELRARTGADLLRVQYTRDDLGRITQAQEALQGTTTTYDYAYDLLGQIVEVRVNGVVSATYSYDANSNRTGVVSAAETVTSAQITLNADDQLTRYGSTLYQYNAAGQRTRKSDGAAITQYTYGVMGELQQVVLPDGRTLTYQYDALKRRIGRKINGTTTHRYLWAGGLSPVAEVDANGITTTAYVYGTGLNVPDYMVRGGVTYVFVRDHLGSVRFVVNAASGAVVQELRYDTFGQVLLDTNPGFQPFGFAGGLYDPDTSLTRFGARDYDAQTGRWTARDPVAFGGGQANLYIYVGNDPVNLVDWSGTNAGKLQPILTSLLISMVVSSVSSGAANVYSTSGSFSDFWIGLKYGWMGALTPIGAYYAGTRISAANLDRCGVPPEDQIALNAQSGLHSAIGSGFGSLAGLIGGISGVLLGSGIGTAIGLTLDRADEIVNEVGPGLENIGPQIQENNRKRAMMPSDY